MRPTEQAQPAASLAASSRSPKYRQAVEAWLHTIEDPDTALRTALALGRFVGMVAERDDLLEGEDNWHMVCLLSLQETLITVALEKPSDQTAAA